MKKTRIVVPGWLILLAVVLLLLYAISMPNYIKVKDRTGGRGYSITLDSGVDKKTTRVNPDITSEGGYGGSYDAAESSGGEAYYSGDYAEAKADSSSPEATSPATENGRQRQVQGSRPGFAIDVERIKSWFVPAAYAADHRLGDRYLVRTGECCLQVDKYKEASNKLSAIAERYGGMVSDSESARAEDDTTQGSVVLRIPSARFAQAWSEVLQVGKVLQERATTQDVSQDYLANVSKLKNLVSEQAALQNMLDEALRVQRTRGLGEGYKILLDTQERLFNIIDELATTEDALNALADQITRSTIKVTLTEKNELPAQVKEEFTWNTGTTAATAYHDLLLYLRARLNGLVYFLITCWTWVVPLAFFIWLGLWFYRRFMVPRGFVVPALVRVQHLPVEPPAGDEGVDRQ